MTISQSLLPGYHIKTRKGFQESQTLISLSGLQIALADIKRETCNW